MQYLELLEGENSESKDSYLWPSTNVGDFQKGIKRKFGASDYDLKYGRSGYIIRQIESLLHQGHIKPDFTLLDICCGDAIILWQIKKKYPKASCYGIDIYANELEIHKKANKSGVKLYKILLQNLFEKNAKEKFDIVTMFNTYRGWENANLSNDEKSLPKLADSWFMSNAAYTIITATIDQIYSLKEKGFRCRYMGKGESGSAMICVSMYNELPFSLLSSLGFWFYRTRKLIGKAKS